MTQDEQLRWWGALAVVVVVVVVVAGLCGVGGVSPTRTSSTCCEHERLEYYRAFMYMMHVWSGPDDVRAVGWVYEYLDAMDDALRTMTPLHVCCYLAQPHCDDTQLLRGMSFGKSVDRTIDDLRCNTMCDIIEHYVPEAQAVTTKDRTLRVAGMPASEYIARVRYGFLTEADVRDVFAKRYARDMRVDECECKQ